MASVTIYTSQFCGYCVAAKRLMAKLGIDYEEIDVTHDDRMRADMVKRASGRRTVPQIFIGEEGIGGYTDLVDLDRGGRLDALLERQRK
jgi:glutaredoxin 3